MKNTAKQIQTEDPFEMAKTAAVAAQERRAQNTKILDLRRFEAFTIFFVICSGTSDRQVEGISDKILEDLEEQWGARPWRREGERKSDWILLDYVDFVVHIFLNETRQFYNLERLWSEANEVEVPELELPEGHSMYDDDLNDDFDELEDYDFEDFQVNHDDN